MHKLITAVIGLLLFSAALLPARSADPAPESMGTWKINNWTPGDSVGLTLSYRNGTSRWEWSSHVPIADLEGLTTGQLRSVHDSAAFTIRRDAGTFTFEGAFSLGIGRGEFRFVPDPSFATKLSALGYEKVDADTASIMMMAVRGVSLAYAREVKNAGLSNLRVSDLVRLLDHGADLEFIRGLTAAGYVHLTADDVVGLKDHGVDAKYLQGLKSGGATDLTAAEIINLHDHGVGSDFVTRLRAAGNAGLPVDQIIDLHDHGVGADYVERLRATGYAGLPVDQILSLHDHGVGPDYVARLRAAGYGDLTVAQIIKLHDHGVD